MTHQRHVSPIVMADLTEIAGPDQLAGKRMGEQRDAGVERITLQMNHAGVRQHQADKAREIKIAHHLVGDAPCYPLEPLLDTPGVSFVSLQVGPRARDFAALAEGAIVDLSPELTDFAETAGAVKNLDLVIGVDTAVVHLAGATATPAWPMLAFSPDWRWMLNRDDSPWYPTLRLYRQTRPGDWTDVISRVAADLREKAARLKDGTA
jgi:glycosyl transferase family 9 (putative heptosyltransferase)